ncbi:MAG TPA: hypothetical protein VMU25_03025 [Candidatus Paceibacterota bacterium]|nr:hypothetical protein [Candidatus Paceibacterota bacterium]
MSEKKPKPIAEGFRKKLKENIFGFDPFSLQDFVEWVGGWGVSRALALGIIYVGLWSILSLEIPNLGLFALSWFTGTAPVWAPVFLAIGAWNIWIWYLHSLYAAGRDPILLEMKIPRDIYKSPRAMELALNNLWLGSGEATFYQRAWKGQVRPEFAFEIVSFGGEIHFYIHTWRAYKEVVESAIYGQYPEVELYEVEDYATKFVWDPEKYKVFATDYTLSAPTKTHYGKDHFSGADVMPIKSYIDFELDKDPKEEFKVEPLSTVLENLAILRPDEQIWISFVFRRCGKYGTLVTSDREKEWRKAVQDEIDRLRALWTRIPKSAVEAAFPGKDISDLNKISPANVLPISSTLQAKTITNMERHLEKLPFEFIGHAVYITTGSMRGQVFAGMRTIWKPFSGQPNMADISATRWHNTFDFPWQDFGNYRHTLQSRRFFDVYRRRAGFHAPWKFPTNVMTNEALASIWHPPSRTVAVPGLQRIPAQKASPPANLPTR